MVEKSGIPYDIVEYLKTPLTKSELSKVLKGLNMDALSLIRTKDKQFKELGYSKNDQRENNEWLEILSENPRFMERPIVNYKGRYRIGRPPEKVLEILK